MSSYRLIGVYNTDSNNLWNWGGAHSGVATTVAGTTTAWGSTFTASSFDVGDTFSTGYTDVLNSGGFGTDELNLSSLLAHQSGAAYSVSNAAVFNWSPGNVGFGCDNFSIANGTLSDSLNFADWGLVQDYEISINQTDAQSIQNVNLYNWKNTNVQYDGSYGFVTVQGAQSGTFDFSHETGFNSLTLYPEVNSAQGSTSTFDVVSGQYGMSLAVEHLYQAGSDYAGTALTIDGSTSLVDFFDSNGGNLIDLTNSAISSNLYLTGTGESLAFVTSAGAVGNTVNLAQAGGAANIFTNDSGAASLISGFTFGRDHLDMVVGTAGSTLVNSFVNYSNIVQSTITDVTGRYGVEFSGISASQLASHITTATEGGVSHLLVS